jgi:NAD(P) transhydrogenase subunit alpha
VAIIGLSELSRRVPVTASQMLSSNLCNLVEHFWDKESKRLVVDREDEIMQGCLVTFGGEIVNTRIRDVVGKGQ